jgi:beta-N-acetylhexosaminidase
MNQDLVMPLGPVMLDIAGLSLSAEDRELLCHPQVGALILFSRNYESREQLDALVREVRELRQPALLIAVDQEGGRVQRFREGFSELPPLRWIGKEYDLDPVRGRDMARVSARLMATELLAHGIDFSFAPVVDLDWGCCEVIGDRALHTDPEIVANLSVAYMHGLGLAGMAAVAKHFPGHGAVVADSHVTLPEDSREFRALLDDIAPYRSLVDAGLQGVMMAHIRYIAVDQEIASLSGYWMRTVLREELGFQGAIFSDDLSMEGAAVGGSIPDRAATALEGGADMVLLCNDRASAGPLLDSLNRYSDPAAQGRLAAMRPDRDKYAAAAYGTPEWQQMVGEVKAIGQPAEFKLDG